MRWGGVKGMREGRKGKGWIWGLERRAREGRDGG